MKAKKIIKSVLRHGFLVVLCTIWLVPIVWIVLTSFSTDPGINIRNFFPEEYTLVNYHKLVFGSDTVSQFPNWFKNTFIIGLYRLS